MNREELVDSIEFDRMFRPVSGTLEAIVEYFNERGFELEIERPNLISFNQFEIGVGYYALIIFNKEREPFCIRPFERVISWDKNFKSCWLDKFEVLLEFLKSDAAGDLKWEDMIKHGD